MGWFTLDTAFHWRCLNFILKKIQHFFSSSIYAVQLIKHDKPIKSFHTKSFNHSVFPSFSSLKLILQSGVLQPNNKTSSQNSEVDFPCSIVMGPKTVGSARWNSWELGISNWETHSPRC